MNMEHSDVPFRFLRIIGIVCPSIDFGCFRLPMQIKYLNDSFPYRLSLKCLFYGHAFNVGRFHAMQFANHGLQFLDMTHYSFPAFFLDTLRHMVTAPVLMFEKLMA